MIYLSSFASSIFLALMLRALAHSLLGWLLERLTVPDWLVYQDLEDLVRAVHHENANIEAFDTSCFSGEYVTGDVSQAYLDDLEVTRSDLAKARRDARLRQEEIDDNEVVQAAGAL